MLKELIREKHEAAEGRPFVRHLLSGNITRKQYATYLYNQALAYNELEKRADRVLVGIEDIRRSAYMMHDLLELDEHDLRVMPSTVAYIDYIRNAELTDEDLMAHVYVRHMGDLHGGQMIKRVVPGAGRTYEFEERYDLIQRVREKLSDDMAEEANTVFDFAIGLFEDLEDEFDIRQAG